MSTGMATTQEGTEVFYKDWGMGQPVVFSHGWPLNADAWDDQLFFMASNGFRAVAHDRRGHGRSSQPWDGNDMDHYADDLAAVIEELDLHDVVLVGHSMGGLHAINLAARYPGRVRALVIVDASPEPLPVGAERAQRLLTGRPERFQDRAEARAYLERTSPGYPDAVYENRLAFAFREENGGLVWRSDPAALGRIMSVAMSTTRAASGASAEPS